MYRKRNRGTKRARNEYWLGHQSPNKFRRLRLICFLFWDLMPFSSRVPSISVFLSAVMHFCSGVSSISFIFRGICCRSVQESPRFVLPHRYRSGVWCLYVHGSSRLILRSGPAVPVKGQGMCQGKRQGQDDND